jgi:hypothetical protein
MVAAAPESLASGSSGGLHGAPSHYKQVQTVARCPRQGARNMRRANAA